MITQRGARVYLMKILIVKLRPTSVTTRIGTRRTIKCNLSVSVSETTEER